MPKVTRKMPSGTGVAAASTATFRLPIGLTFEQLFIAYAGATLAQLNEIRLLANGKVVQRWVEATVLDAINQFEGRAAAAGILTLDLLRFGLRTRQAEEVTGIGTGWNNTQAVRNGTQQPEANPVETLTLEVDIDAAAVAPVLNLTARQSAPKPVGLIKKVRRFNYNPAAAGEFEVADLPRGDLINRIILGGHAANVYTDLRIERDNFREFDRTAALNIMVQADGVRVPQADYVVYDPTEDGFGNEALATQDVHDLRIIPTVTNAGGMPVIVEYIGPLEI
jgi:hypothetical protein